MRSMPASMARVCRALVLCPLLHLGYGCTGKDEGSPVSWRRVDETDLTPAQKSQAQRARDARTALFSRLLGELTKALEAGGPPAAVKICSERAPAMAAAISAETGVKIGRTSFRLRNPRNRPPEWAARLVEERVNATAQLASSDGRLGVLAPIVTAPPCLACHGPPEQIAGEVKKALSEAYPADQAIGFREGDLRGWFWVEVPVEAGRG